MDNAKNEIETELEYFLLEWDMITQIDFLFEKKKA